MNSDGVVRFLSGTHSASESAQVQFAHGPGMANRKDRLENALSAVCLRRFLLACAVLLTFLLALSAFIMALNAGDQATKSPTTTAVVAPKCAANWQRFQSSCYRVTSSSDFAGVESECERNFKGSLASVHDEKENDFIAKFVRTSHAAEKEFFIGLTSNFTGHWIWLDKSALNYAAWKPGQPSGNNTSEHCVQVATAFGPISGLWEVTSCDIRRPSVCKRDLAHYGEEEEPEAPIATASTTSATTAFSCPTGFKCGSGTISSPQGTYPGYYDENLDVLYHLMASSPDSVVLLKFASIHTGKDDAHVTVYDGNLLNSRVLKTYTGSYPSAELVQSTGQYMTVRLTTGRNINRGGFTATFSSQKKP